MQYAGFLVRLGAYIIDAIILIIFHFIIGFSGFSEVLVSVLDLLVGFGYNIGMESSKYQATLGKMALNIKVVNYDGGRISIGQAFGRYFAKFLSAIILFFGFLMVAFTEKKQGLHDIIAKTLVVKSE